MLGEEYSPLPVVTVTPFLSPPRKDMLDNSLGQPQGAAPTEGIDTALNSEALTLYVALTFVRVSRH